MENLEMIVQQQAGLLSWNFEQINQTVDEITKRFDGTVYTDEMIADAKKDKASLNKLAKEINAKKIAVKKEYNKPYDIFEKQVKEVIGKIKDVSDQIDAQVKAYEEKEKADKKEIIKAYWQTLDTGIDIAEIFDESWLNKTCQEKVWQTELELKAERFKRELLTIKNISDTEQRVFFESCYQKNHDISQCMSEWQKYQSIREKAEEAKKQVDTEISKKTEEAIRQEQKIAGNASNQATEHVYTRVLNVRGTKEQLKILAQYMTSIGVEYWGEK